MPHNPGRHGVGHDTKAWRVELSIGIFHAARHSSTVSMQIKLCARAAYGVSDGAKVSQNPFCLNQSEAMPARPEQRFAEQKGALKNRFVLPWVSW